MEFVKSVAHPDLTLGASVPTFAAVTWFLLPALFLNHFAGSTTSQRCSNDGTRKTSTSDGPVVPAPISDL
jgi:hypothetical protein